MLPIGGTTWWNQSGWARLAAATNNPKSHWGNPRKVHVADPHLVQVRNSCSPRPPGREEIAESHRVFCRGQTWSHSVAHIPLARTQARGLNLPAMEAGKCRNTGTLGRLHSSLSHWQETPEALGNGDQENARA